MRYSLAEITDVCKAVTGNSAMLELEQVSGRCPPRLIVMAPPRNFDACIGTTLQITFDAVYVNDQLWAKRSLKDRAFVQLVARRKKRCVT